MPVAVTLTDYTPGIRNSTQFYQLLFSGSYGGTTVGDTVNFNAASNPGLDLEPGMVANPPEGVPGIYAENLGGGYIQFVPNPATPGIFTVLVYEASGTEVPEGTYPANFTGAGNQAIVTLKKKSV